MKIKLLLFGLINLFTIELLSASSDFKTFEFSAQVDDVTTPKAGLAATIDTEKNTHIAWVEQKNGLRSIMYSFYNGTDVTTTRVYQGAEKEGPVAPSITVDNENKPHIVFFTKRNTDLGSRSGNYAIYYAGLQGESFHVEQVSTNPTDPEADTDGIYNCYVNGRPQITNKNGTIVITYLSDKDSFNGWVSYVISATLSYGSWNLKQEYNIDEIGHISEDWDISLPVYCDDSFIHAFIDISDYDPYVCYYDYGWNNYMVSGYTGWAENKDLHVDYVNQSTYYLSWLHDGDDKKVFVGVNLTSNEITEYPVSRTPAGNFTPSTYDLTTGDFVGFYTEDWTYDGYLVTTDNNGDIVETKLENENIGITYGKRVLNARDGYISLVTAAESREKIYITTNTGSQTESLIAGFQADKNTIRVGDSVIFTDTSDGNPTAWEWAFPGGNPTSSALQNPVVNYTTEGVFDVSLIVYNDNGEQDDTTIVDYITVEAAEDSVNSDTLSPGIIPTNEVIYRLTDNSVNDKYPMVGNKRIVWVQELDDGFNIMMFDGEEQKQLYASSRDLLDKNSISFDGRFILWWENLYDYNNSQNNIKYIDLMNPESVKDISIFLIEDGSIHTYDYSNGKVFYYEFYTNPNTWESSRDFRYIDLTTGEDALFYRISDDVDMGDINTFIAGKNQVFFSSADNIVYCMTVNGYTQVSTNPGEDYLGTYDENAYMVEPFSEYDSIRLKYYDGQEMTIIESRLRDNITGAYGCSKYYNTTWLEKDYLNWIVFSWNAEDTIFTYNVHENQKEAVYTAEDMYSTTLGFDQNRFAFFADSGTYISGVSDKSRWFEYYDGQSLTSIQADDWPVERVTDNPSMDQGVYAITSNKKDATGTWEEDTEILVLYLENVENDNPEDPDDTETDTLNFEDNLDLYFLYVEQGGYITGNNYFGDLAKANYFENQNSWPYMSGLICSFAQAKGDADSLEFIIWEKDAMSDVPGNVITSFKHPFDDIKTDVENNSYTYVQLPVPVTLGNAFFAGIVLPQALGDTIALNMYDVNDGNAWEQFASEAWHPFSSDNSWGIEVNLAIFPVVTSSQTTGTNDNLIVRENKLVRIKTYPNPFNSNFTVEIPDGLEINNLKIFDLMGRIVKETPVNSQSSFEVQLEKAKSGLYILQLSGQSGTYGQLIKKQ